MKYGLLDVLGNIGVVILMIAYLLLQLNKLSSGLVYSVLNALGASLIVISLIANFNLSAFLIEVFWILISLIGIYRHLRPGPVQL
jgi:multidrug transporter EmrE-like cation transporter